MRTPHSCNLDLSLIVYHYFILIRERALAPLSLIGCSVLLRDALTKGEQLTGGQDYRSQGSLVLLGENEDLAAAPHGSKPTVFQLVEGILLDCVGRHGRTAGSGANGDGSGAAIVYVHKCVTAESLAASLVRSGFRAAAYSAKAAPDARTSVLERWRSRQLDVVVATVAFGMGIDRAGKGALKGGYNKGTA